MRIAPLGFFVDPLSQADREVVRYVSRITHRNEEAYVGALAILVAMHRMARGDRGIAPLSAVGNALPDTVVRDRILAATRFPDVAPEEIAGRFGSSGYVVESVPQAIYIASSHWPCLQDALVAAIGCGGDTDTIASMVGQLLGAASS